MIEKHHAMGREEVRLNIGGRDIIVNMREMKQYRADDPKKTRRLQYLDRNNNNAPGNSSNAPVLFPNVNMNPNPAFTNNGMNMNPNPSLQLNNNIVSNGMIQPGFVNSQAGSNMINGNMMAIQPGFVNSQAPFVMQSNPSQSFIGGMNQNLVQKQRIQPK